MRDPGRASVAIVVCLLLSLSSTASAPESPSPLDREPSNPALARFGNAVVFYLSGDGHEFAEITAGSPEPHRERWDEFVKARESPYQPGVFGRSLVSGDYSLSYLSGPKARLAGTGAVVLWLRGETLRHRGEYYWPIRLHVANSHQLMFGRAGDPRNKEQLYAYLEHGPHHTSAEMGSMADWRAGDWHLVVVNWDRHGVELSLDGQPPTRASLREPLPAVDPTEFRVVVNSTTDEAILLDELMVLNVPVRPAEITWLWCGGRGDTTPPR